MKKLFYLAIAILLVGEAYCSDSLDEIVNEKTPFYSSYSSSSNRPAQHNLAIDTELDNMESGRLSNDRELKKSIHNRLFSHQAELIELYKTSYWHGTWQTLHDCTQSFLKFSTISAGALVGITGIWEYTVKEQSVNLAENQSGSNTIERNVDLAQTVSGSILFIAQGFDVAFDYKLKLAQKARIELARKQEALKDQFSKEDFALRYSRYKVLETIASYMTQVFTDNSTSAIERWINDNQQ